MTIRGVACLVLVAALSLVLCGCYSRIVQEDSAQDGVLPPVDPGDGVSIQQTVMVYYKKTNEERLIAEEKTVKLKPAQTLERAVAQAVLEGPAVNSTTCEAVVTQGVPLYGLEIENSIIYVTLGKEFLDRSDITLLQLRFHAMVNSLLAVSEAKSVLILIDSTGKGVGANVRRWAFGFSDDEDQYMEPLGFERSVIAEDSWLPDFAQGGNS